MDTGGVLSASHHPTTEVFAFSPPEIKGDGVAFDAVLGAGKRTKLHATRPVWHALTRYLLQVFPELAKRASTTAKAERAPRQHGRPPLRFAQYQPYLLAHRDVQSGARRSLRAACFARELNYRAAMLWLRNHAAEVPALIAALPPAPILKPNGKIL